MPDPPGPSSVPGSRAASPSPDPALAPLRRPASHGRLAMLMVPGRSRSSSSASQDAAAATTAVTAYPDEGTSSGRTTPEMRRRNARAAAASLLANDAKYKKFTAQVDRCLQSFESVNEWADFISFLSRLLKTLQTPSPSYSEIPRKLIVAKRLAQCLNPALPSGVHTRALDVYGFVFATIGHEGLRRDLLIWSSGLFPFFQFASTSVRPALIKLYEKYYIPLGEDLRPATKAMVLALLPGLEEETGDFFDKILALLATLSDAVSPAFFLQNVFLILISAPASRLAALNYLARKLLQPPDASGNDDHGLMIRGVAAALGDDNMLVRRTALDLLLRTLPLNGAIMQAAAQTDREYLARAASEVILHRDMSLSRRVYTWLLGKEETAAQQVAHFRQHGLALLVGTLQADMQKVVTSPDGAPDVQTPFKILLSFLDKWEIAEALSTELVIPALALLRQAAQDSPVSAHTEAFSTAAAIYENVEPELLWSVLGKQVVDGVRDSKTAGLDLLLWLVSSIRQHDEETTLLHAPKMLDTLLGMINANEVPHSMLEPTLRLSAALLDIIPAQSFAHATPRQPAQHIEGEGSAEAAKREQADVGMRIVRATFDMCRGVLLATSASPDATLLALGMTRTLVDQDVGMLSSVDGAAWLRVLIGRLARAAPFAVVERLIDTTLRASRAASFAPPLDIAAADDTATILGALFRYLRPQAAVHHVRAVELLWEYNQLAEVHALETVVARRMNGPAGRAEAFEAFGVLWRQTDDAMLPGEIFYAPVLRVLDALHSDDPAEVGMAETWLRCNLRSYFRVLDPVLHRLLLQLRPRDAKKPTRTADRSQIRYLLQSLLSLFRFAGQGLSKACRASHVAGSSHSSFVDVAHNVVPNASTYLDLLIDMLARLVIAEPDRHLGETGADPRDVRVQATSLELLELLVSRGDLTPANTVVIRECLLDKLEMATRSAHLSLQNTMLHLLHATISNTSERPKGHRPSASLSALSEKSPRPDEHPPEFDIHLLRVCVNGLSAPTNRPVLQHWVDFVLMLSPYLERRPHLLLDLCDCVCEQLRVAMRTLRDVYAAVAAGRDRPCDLTDAEPAMLLLAIERVATLLSGRAPGRRSEDALRAVSDEGKGILGYLPTVFSVEAPQDNYAQNSGPKYLDDVMDALLVTWTVTAAAGPDSSAAQAFAGVRAHTRKVLDKLFKAQPSEVIVSGINVWAIKSSDVDDTAVFDCIDVLTPSAQKVVEAICDSLGNKPGRGGSADRRPDPAFMAFLEAYIARLEGPIAVQVWNTLYGYARDVLGAASTPSARSQLFSVLRCLTVLGRIVATTSALEDKRLRRDLQDTYVKVLDVVVGNIPRLAETAVWERSVSDDLGDGDGSSEKDSSQTVASGTVTIHDFITASVIPNLRTFLLDNDKVAAACSTISFGILVPAFKQQRVDASVLGMLAEMTRIPAAVKSWRLLIGDAFNDARFFRAAPADAARWKPLVRALMDSDRERLGDLLGRIAAAPSANIFTNREHEMLVRSLNLRRLSFVLLAGENNGQLTMLPSIQEKLVEILRTNVVSPRVHSEVYLCLRVLMCRISPQHLTNFWPVILAELLRVFEATMDDPPADGSEDLQLVLAACKFLDLLLVIQSEDFQIHQWIFVTDTTDAAYPPDGYQPESIMDRLSEILTEHAHATLTVDAALDEPPNPAGPRRPRLAGVRTLTRLHQLHTFFARASMDTFEGVYANAGVDWEAVESGLVGEIFEGRAE